MIQIKEGDICPVCDTKGLKRNVRKIKTFKFKDSTFTVIDYITYDCSLCKNGFPDDAQWKELSPKIKEWQDEVRKKNPS